VSLLPNNSAWDTQVWSVFPLAARPAVAYPDRIRRTLALVGVKLRNRVYVLVAAAVLVVGSGIAGFGSVSAAAVLAPRRLGAHR